MKRSSTTPLIAALFAASTAAAQDPAIDDPGYQTRFTNIATYAMSFPIHDTRDFISDVSWAGIALEGQWTMRRSTSAGFGFAIYDFADRTDGTTNFASGSATGQQFRDLMSVTLMGIGRWFPRGVAGRGIHLGLGVGGVYNQQTYQLGVMPQFYRSAIHLATAPEIGTAIPVWEGVDVVVTARYLLPIAAGAYLGGGSRSFQFFTLAVGVAEH